MILHLAVGSKVTKPQTNSNLDENRKLTVTIRDIEDVDGHTELFASPANCFSLMRVNPRLIFRNLPRLIGACKIRIELPRNS